VVLAEARRPEGCHGGVTPRRNRLLKLLDAAATIDPATAARLLD
jgi:hypothetical protein